MGEQIGAIRLEAFRGRCRDCVLICVPIDVYPAIHGHDRCRRQVPCDCTTEGSMVVYMMPRLSFHWLRHYGGRSATSAPVLRLKDIARRCVRGDCSR